MVSCPYVPFRADPRDPPDIALTVSESPSASVSFDKTPLPELTETLASSSTAPVSALPTGALFETGALVTIRRKSAL